MRSNLAHSDEAGKAFMIDVSPKPVTSRIAVARGIIRVNKDAYRAVDEGTVQQGDVFGVARVAGIMAAKRTSDIIPLCHPLPLARCDVDFHMLAEEQAIEAVATVKVNGQTGVEMEALHAVTAALLTIYDMCRPLDRNMKIGEIYIVRREGGAFRRMGK